MASWCEKSTEKSVLASCSPLCALAYEIILWSISTPRARNPFLSAFTNHQTKEQDRTTGEIFKCSWQQWRDFKPVTFLAISKVMLPSPQPISSILLNTNPFNSATVSYSSNSSPSYQSDFSTREKIFTKQTCATCR